MSAATTTHESRTLLRNVTLTGVIKQRTTTNETTLIREFRAACQTTRP